MINKLSLIKTIIIFLFLTSAIFPQYNGHNFGLSLNYSYTTTSKLYLNPNSPDLFLRSASIPLDDIFSYSAELRFRLTSPVILGISIERIAKTAKGRNLSSPMFIVDDGYLVYPIELSGYYYLPFSTERFKFFMGGGLGFYYGERTRKLGNAELVDVKREIGYGIQVSLGMDYLIFDMVSLRGEMRFRDPDFKVKSKYNKESVEYEGRTYQLTGNELDSQVNINGITFRLGAVLHF